MGIRDTGTGRWHWFMGMRYGAAQPNRGDGIDLWWHTMGVRHWLDLGDGIDVWGRTMGVRDTGLVRGNGIDLWERAEWQSTIWFLNSNDDTMCPHVWHWGKCAECVWLRVGRCKLMGWCVRGGDPSVGWRGCAPHVLNHQWVWVGGVLCVR